MKLLEERNIQYSTQHKREEISFTVVCDPYIECVFLMDHQVLTTLHSKQTCRGKLEWVLALEEAGPRRIEPMLVEHLRLLLRIAHGIFENTFVFVLDVLIDIFHHVRE